jgi:ribosomal protein S18 acetylase RimI-like enzyme
MANIILRVAQRDDYPELAEWLVRISQVPKQHCLHTWSGQSAEELRRQLLSYLDDSELCYILAVRDGQLVGAMGSEYDEGLARGWLHGPHVIAEDGRKIASQLFARLLVELPACIRQLDAYLNVKNVRGRSFYTQRGFRESETLSYDFWLTPAGQTASKDGLYGRIETRHEASFLQLFQAMFPTAYYSGERILRMIGMSHQAFVVAEGSEVLGFAVVGVEAGSSAGEVQFLGVREDCRGQGYGRRLLQSAVGWLFEGAGVTRVCLNVGEEALQARRLYESAGFNLKFVGVGLQWHSRR